MNIRRWGSLGDILESICHITCFSSVQSLSRVRLFVIPWTAARQASCPSPTPRSCSNSCPLNWWCYTTISSSVIPFSSYLQSFPASGSFPVSQLFASDGQSIHLFIYSFVEVFQLQHQSFQWIFRTDLPLELTDLISLLTKGLARVFSNTTVQEHQFFGTQPSLWSNSHITCLVNTKYY